ncbi:MAG: RNA polymerase sigma factor [Patescibacteria group bacterium]
MAITDEELVANFRKTGDIKFFEELVNRYKNSIYNFTLRYLSHREDTEDIVQNIFVKVYFKLDKYDEKKASFKTWIYRVSKNTIYNKFRERKLLSLNFEITDTHKEEDAYERENLIQVALNKIGKKYRIVLLMYYMEGFSYIEISKILNLPLGTVKTRIRRAKGKIKNELDGYI